MTNWKEYKLGEICSKIGSGATPKGGGDTYLESGDYALIRSQNVHDFYFSYNGLAFISEDQAKKLNNVTLEENDILLNITGDSVARVCQIPKNLIPARVNQHVAIIRPNESIIRNDFLKYFLLNPVFKEYMLMLSSSGATRNAITKGMIENFPIFAPDISTQTAIAEILSSLDDKIELNNKINQELENLAQTLFKQWFIDFEFPANLADSALSAAEGYKSSGGEMVDSELGEIPMGWEVKCLDEVITVKYGKDHKGLIDGKIPVYGSGGIMRFANKALYDKVSILIPRKGTLSNLFFIHEPFWSVDTMFYTEIHNENYAKYLFYQIKMKNLASMNVGSAVPSMTTKVLNNLAILIPIECVITKFDNTLNPLFNLIRENTNENQELTNLRDTLLPKLISGELEVKNVNI
jgi:type I restriction enzyme, S subunit